jgi:hypothetical protein
MGLWLAPFASLAWDDVLHARVTVNDKGRIATGFRQLVIAPPPEPLDAARMLAVLMPNALRCPRRPA